MLKDKQVAVIANGLSKEELMLHAKGRALVTGLPAYDVTFEYEEIAYFENLVRQKQIEARLAQLRAQADQTDPAFTENHDALRPGMFI